MHDDRLVAYLNSAAEATCDDRRNTWYVQCVTFHFRVLLITFILLLIKRTQDM